MTSKSSSVIIIRSSDHHSSSVVIGEEDSNPFGCSDVDMTPSSHVSHQGHSGGHSHHHHHSMMSSSAVKKDVNLSSTLIKRERSHSLNIPTTLDRYCESPSFLNHHLGGSDDDDVDESSADGGRVSRMSADADLMFSCSNLRDDVVTPTSIICGHDSVTMTIDDVVCSSPTSAVPTTTTSTIMSSRVGHGRRVKIVEDMIDEGVGVDDDDDDLSDLNVGSLVRPHVVSIKREPLDPLDDDSCLLTSSKDEPTLNHYIKGIPSVQIVKTSSIQNGGTTRGQQHHHPVKATIHSPLILSQLNATSSPTNPVRVTKTTLPDSSSNSQVINNNNNHVLPPTTQAMTTSNGVSSTTGQKVTIMSSGISSQQPVTLSNTTILPAGIIQLASNLATIFPSSGNKNQQIALQLLREDGTSIILPITTRSSTNTTAGATATVLISTTNNNNNSSTLTIHEQSGGANNNATHTTTSTNNNVIITKTTSSQGKRTSNNHSTSSTITNTSQDSNSSSGESDRPFKCELCNSTFTRLGNYTRHKKIHSLPTKEDQRFRCDICSKSFIQRCDLARHLHIHRGTEPHRCPQCGKGYIRHSDLVTHQRFHNKEKPFACPHCSKGFCQRGDLNRHLRSIHLQLKPILCSHCHKKFAKEETLLRHINSTHRDKLLENN